MNSEPARFRTQQPYCRIFCWTKAFFGVPDLSSLSSPDAIFLRVTVVLLPSNCLREAFRLIGTITCVLDLQSLPNSQDARFVELFPYRNGYLLYIVSIS